MTLTGSVLVVDPDAGARDACALELARAGFRVETAGNSQVGMRVARRFLPDNVVTEILLPVFDGFAFARRLRREPVTSRAGIIALTSYPGDDLRQRAVESGIDAVLRKPGASHALLRLMREVSARRLDLVDQRKRLVKPWEALRAEVEQARREFRQNIEDLPHSRCRAQATIAKRRAPAHHCEGAIRQPGGGEPDDGSLLSAADGARDVMIVDQKRGERLFDELMKRYDHAPILRYKRGEAYRALGRRKLAYFDFVAAFRRLPDGEWRERARIAASRTRSHHEGEAGPDTNDVCDGRPPSHAAI